MENYIIFISSIFLTIALVYIGVLLIDSNYKYNTRLIYYPSIEKIYTTVPPPSP